MNLFPAWQGSARVWALCVALLGNGCEFGSTGGSETTNGLTGVIRTQDGKPAAHARVALVPDTYNPVPGLDARRPQVTETDAGGKYRFSGVAAGGYGLEAKDSMARKMLLLGLRIPSTGASVTADGALKPTGTLRLPLSGLHLPEDAILYIPGTTFMAYPACQLDEDGFLVLSGIPEADYPALMAYLPDTGNGSSMTIAEEFHIGSGETTTLAAFQAWSHSRALRFDLSAFGAVPDSLAAYPLLVRLHAGNFDFSQAAEGGRDLRFTGRHGHPAAFQIESWDADAKSAAIWVRVDSPVNGSDSLTLYWGRPEANGISDGGRVFAADSEFTAVWHLGETANTDSGGYQDAGAFGLHASAAAPNPASDTFAVIGKGKLFVDSGGQLSAPFPAALGGNAAFTITFWMKFRMATLRQGVLTLGEESPSRGLHFLIRPDTMSQVGPWDTTSVLPSTQQNSFSLAPFLGSWIHVASVYDPAARTVKTYVNGNLMAENIANALDLQPGYGVSIGTKVHRISTTAKDTHFNGALDEVRIYNRVLPASFFRWDYATQKENATVVTSN